MNEVLNSTYSADVKIILMAINNAIDKEYNASSTEVGLE